MRRYVTDFAMMNAIALALSFLAHLPGSKLLDTFVFVLFVESGLVLVLAGLFGFLLTQSLLWSFRKYFRRIEIKEEDWKAQTREKRSIGKRLTVLGAALLAETILLALAMM